MQQVPKTNGNRNPKKLFNKRFYNTGYTKFEGRIEMLKSFVYDFVGTSQSELYVRTIM